MNIVDIIAICLLALGALLGFKKGAIKTLIQLVGLVAIIIVAYQFKGYIASFLISNLPFFNFPGAYEGLYAMNILLYEGVSFLVLFVLLYCILNILIDLAGILDLVVKITIIFEPISKIIGAVLGAIEMAMFIFVAGFTLISITTTQTMIADSKVVSAIVYRTPIVHEVFLQPLAATKEIVEAVKSSTDNEDKVDANLEIVRALIRHGVVRADEVQKCIDNGKLHMDNVVVAS